MLNFTFIDLFRFFFLDSVLKIYFFHEYLIFHQDIKNYYHLMLCVTFPYTWKICPITLVISYLFFPVLYVSSQSHSLSLSLPLMSFVRCFSLCLKKKTSKLLDLLILLFCFHVISTYICKGIGYSKYASTWTRICSRGY